jgi:hypothetical protein
VAEGRPRGRPSKYTEELADEIAEAVASSERGLEWTCNHNDAFPDARTVWRWVHDNPNFRQKITRAKERQADHLVAGGLVRLQECDPDASNAAVNLARAEADYRLKMVAKTAPRTHGDRKAVDLGGQEGNPVTSVDLSPPLASLSAEDIEQMRDIARKALTGPED